MERKSHTTDTQRFTTLDCELGLPSFEELTPLHQSLIPPVLASAFGIMPTTCSTIFRKEPSSELEVLNLFPDKSEADGCRIRRRADSGDGGDGSDGSNSGGDESGSSSRAVKRPRLVWTPQLHKRFVEVIEQLGVDKAVPKTIMEMMNVEGLTRENVASHLQKYRLYLRKMDGISPDSNSNSMSISTTTTERHSSNVYECGPPMQLSGMHFNSVSVMPLPPILGPGAATFGYGGGQLGMALAAGASGKPGGYCGMESGGYTAMFWNRQG